MRRPLPRLAYAVVLCAVLFAACSDDDGAEVRSAGSVEIVGPPPPEGGGSVSAVGTGCTTKGATTKLAAATLEVNVDEYTLQAPATAKAGVLEVIVRNRGAQPHELIIAKAASREALPVKDGKVDEVALEATGFYKIASFPKSTICRGFFDLAAGTYVLFDNLTGAGQTQSNLQRGMVSVLTLT
ncbi:MAG: hypothetical protein ABIQ73_16465 [Acidimicrobiales bacterium]